VGVWPVNPSNPQAVTLNNIRTIEESNALFPEKRLVTIFIRGSATWKEALRAIATGSALWPSHPTASRPCLDQTIRWCSSGTPP
jgi:hypothetical protein